MLPKSSPISGKKLEASNFFEKLRIDLLKKVDCLWQTNNAKAYQKWHNYQKVAQCVSTHEK